MVHEEDAVGDFARKAHFVGNNQHGHAVRREFQHHVQHFAHHFRVKRGGDFVEQEQIRVEAKGADDGDALLLPAGEFARPGVFALVEADALQEAVGLRFHFGARAFLRF